jgi:starch phosphorylase
MNLSPLFNCQRMLRDYIERMYEPAHLAGLRAGQDGYRWAKEKAEWNRKVERAWPAVTIEDVSGAVGRVILTGATIQLRAAVGLAGLSPGDVRVEAVVGRVNPDGELYDTTVISLPFLKEQDGKFLFGRDFVPHQTGRIGYTLRVTPNRSEDPVTRPCYLPVKWTQRI